MDIDRSISKAMANTMEHLTEFLFISMANLTLTRGDSKIAHPRSGIKPDTAALRAAPLHMATLFLDNVLKKAKEDIAIIESKGHLIRRVVIIHIKSQRNTRRAASQTNQLDRLLGATVAEW